MSQFKMEGQLCVVTGSTSGIGKGIAQEFALQGCYTIVNGRSQKSVDEAVQQICAHDGMKGKDHSRVIGVKGDVSTRDGYKAFIADIEKAAPKGQEVDVLVNNVGIFHVQDFFEIDDDKWQEYFDVNIMSGMWLSRYYLKKMLARNSGRIIFISSEVAERPLPHMMAYSMSKASQVNLARGLAELTKGTNVTVNSVLPGPTMTDGVKVYMDGFAKDKGIPSRDQAIKVYFAEHETTSLLQRFLDPSEIANVVVFLASPLGSGINGNAQRVEGGLIRHI